MLLADGFTFSFLLGACFGWMRVYTDEKEKELFNANLEEINIRRK